VRLGPRVAMKVAVERQVDRITDAARARIAMIRPILRATLFSLQRERVARLGGHAAITLADLAREYREGSGDCGLCFEYAVHEALQARDPQIHPIVSGIIEDFCGIREGAHSILVGADKSGRSELIDTPDDLLTDESRIMVGKTGQPPKLTRHLNRLVRAFRSPAYREQRPASIRGLWRADLFVGSRNEDRWVATTLKINPTDLEADAELHIGIYPERRRGESPARDDQRNLILCPLPYNAGFMELFSSSFVIVAQVLAADGQTPRPVALPAADDRQVARELAARRAFPLLEVISALAPMAQPDLLESAEAGNQGQAETDAVAPIAQKT
jgi:hypothetical protein